MKKVIQTLAPAQIKPRLAPWIERIPVWLFYVLAVTVLSLMALLDLATGIDIVLTLAYLLPVLFVSWFRNLKEGLFFALISILAMFIVDILLEHRGLHLYQTVNAAIRLSVFAIIVFLVHRVRSQQRSLSLMALTDPLTGLRNVRAARQGLEEAFERSSRSGETLGLLTLDADHFKEVNDRMGHAEGDKVLRLIGTVLETRLRRGDLAARMGGDEFLVLFPGADPGSFAGMLEKLKAQLVQTMKAHGYPVTFSMGGVIFTRLPVSVDAMLKVTDEVMYRVKHTGRDGVRVDVWDGGIGAQGSRPAKPAKKRSRGRKAG